ncbi:RagB/SusD family nutrient uptake outer membrane protein [Flexithrix dorotheae]|uniref:RagB/SusD family nutrient uptake outer membrane protein n=1 Tax=Flexithrix dorotheae TaxID=70993 RepID=UPI00035ED3CA|nr:RagB/SusD family nutrient uptake outer membrane protein [Flexithrix dorotheae]
MKKYYSIFISISLLLLSGCNNEEFFELDRPPQAPWQTVDEFELAAVSPYNIAFLNAWSNFYTNDRVIDFIQGDIVNYLGNQEGFPIEAYLARDTKQTVSSINGSFTDGYKVVGICNAGLDFYYSNNENPFPSISEENKRKNVDRIVGELHFMRAFAYFQNVKRHAPPYNPNGGNDDRLLPLRITFPNNVDEATKPEFASTEEIYQLILEDIEIAKKLLPESFENGMHASYEYGRANRYAAAFLKAKVLFQMGKWDDALTEAEYVINSGKYQLETNPIDAFNKDQLGDESSEVIFYVIYSDPFRSSPINEGPKLLTLMNKSHYTAMGGGRGENWSLCPWNQFTLSNDALAKINWMEDPLNGDFSETSEALADLRYQQIYYRMEGYTSDVNANEQAYLKDSKYSSVSHPIIYNDKYYRADFGNNFHMPVMRLPELYLMRAIIKFRSGDASAAANDINILAQRAWDPDYGAFTPLTAADMNEDRIDAEWIKEMACEGNRLHYVFALRNTLTGGFRGLEYENRIIEPPYQDYYWIIPQSELDFVTE